MSKLRPVRAFIDGVIYAEQRVGGISNYFNEILPRVAESPNAEVELLIPPNICGSPPTSPAVRRRRWFPPGSTALAHVPERWRSSALSAGRVYWGLQMAAARDAVFHSTYYTTPPTPHVASVVTVYDLIHEIYPEMFHSSAEERFRILKRDCVSAADRVLAISETTKSNLCERYGIPPERVDVTPLAVDTPAWRRRVASLADDPVQNSIDPYVLYVGTRGHHKNFRRLLRAFARLDTREAISLVAAGGSFSVDEREFIDSLGLGSRVRCVEHPSDDDLAVLYARSSAFVYPSLYEGFGLPLLEAMACGAPVVAAAAGSIPEVAGEAAEYFDPFDEDAIAEALKKVLLSRRADELRRAGQERVEEFNWDRTAALTLVAYRTALEGHNAGVPSLFEAMS